MAKLFPGILYAIVAGVPGFWIGALIAAPRFRERPPLEVASTLVRGLTIYFIQFGLPALVYGSIVWWLLRVIGLLNLSALIIAATIPVLLYFA